ncbi:hypothetical protein D6C83_09331 [Aureobasidium pullulans]|uniref:Uncharacterized protein n=1 Tax=Aureobasidium pullulans TaxID=5580 RepID=A0A4S9YHM9_AURPU|nr:hypothetical protein D6C83_09331 [Aureobasidium pullulans]
MPPTRKAHHKSRGGCVQCKKRHVKNDYLLDAVFAMTCLHRGSLHPLNKSYWLRSAVQYQSRALPMFYKVLDNVNEETCHAAFAL